MNRYKGAVQLTVGDKTIEVQLDLVEVLPGNPMIEVPQYVGMSIEGQRAVALVPVNEFLKDALDTQRKSDDGGLIVVEEHLKKHGRLFEVDADQWVNAGTHLGVLLLKALGKYADQDDERTTTVATRCKEVLRRQAGDKWISNTDPRFVAHARQQMEKMKLP